MAAELLRRVFAIDILTRKCRGGSMRLIALLKCINAKFFAIPQEDVARESFRYVGRYTLAITVFCFVPYVALKVM